MTKVSAVTEDTAPTYDDLLLLVNDPSGTPASRRATVSNVYKAVTSLTADTAPTTDDVILTINDPAGTPAPKKVALGNLYKGLGTGTPSAQTTLLGDGSNSGLPLCKAWVKFNAVSGTPTINSSYNVTSLTDNGTGDVTVNFTTAMSNANYGMFGVCDVVVNSANDLRGFQIVSVAAGSTRFKTVASSATIDDNEYVSVAFFAT